jgi:predicted transcriptional regulator
MINTERVNMKISELANKTSLKAINESTDKEIEGVYISDMASDIITNAKANVLLITLQTHKTLIAAANLIDVAAIVFVKGKKPGQDIIELASRVGIPLLSTEDDTWTFASKLAKLGIQ